MDSMLFEPIQIKGMKLKNRIAFAPMFNMPAGPDGDVTDLTIRWFEERAKGGTALVMHGGTGVTPLPEAVREMMKTMMTPLNWRPAGFADDRFMSEYAKLADVMHSYDCKIGIQMAMQGRPSPPPYPGGSTLLEKFSKLQRHRIPLDYPEM